MLLAPSHQRSLALQHADLFIYFLTHWCLPGNAAPQKHVDMSVWRWAQVWIFFFILILRSSGTCFVIRRLLRGGEGGEVWEKSHQILSGVVDV